MANDRSAGQESGRAGERGYQPLSGSIRPGPGATGVQGGYQPEMGQQAPRPPNEGSGVQPPKKRTDSSRQNGEQSRGVGV
jgi:hypothetical protein